MEPRLLLSGTPVINEFLADNESIITDQFGDYSDFIELHNPTASPISLNGWYLTDNAANRTKWRLPAVTLDAGAYLVIFASDRNLIDPAGELHTNFRLSDNGEYLGLIMPDGITAAHEFAPMYPAQDADISYGLDPTTGAATFLQIPTPGGPNIVIDPKQQVVINEIMYHPNTSPTRDAPRDEWIELYNRGTEAVNLSGWRFTAGVDYTFGDVTIAGGGYVIVAADTARFNGKYGSVGGPVVGGWTGVLSNSGERIELVDELGDTIDQVTYSDEGDWGERFRTTVGGSLSWEWRADHDGAGRSLELRNAQLTNNVGQNWGPSTVAQGTPGAVNSLYSTNVAPLISDVVFSPVIPTPTQPVVVTMRVRDESAEGIVATLFYRVDSAATFTATLMFDDGAHGDGAAGDGIYAGAIPQQPAGSIVEFYVRARDAQVQNRTWPAPGIEGGVPVQAVNMAYQVEQTVAVSDQPFYRLIMTPDQRALLSNISSNNPGSDAQVNATFISTDGVSTQVVHNVGVRIRGQGSRSRNPKNYRLNFPHDHEWNGVDAINLNTQYTHAQLMGMMMFREAGLAHEEARAVQVRVNGQNLAGSGSPQFGSYVHLEVPDDDWAENHYPLDPDGNVYRGESGGLQYLGTNPGSYNGPYSKNTNEEANDFSDLVSLTNALNNVPDAQYVAAVEAVIDVMQWMRWFAVNTLLDNNENGLFNGLGDDYGLYRGVNDPRFHLLPHDLDTVMGQGDNPGSVTAPVFAVDGSGNAGLLRLLHHPQFAGVFYEQLVDLANTVFEPSNVNALLDQYLGGWVPETTIAAMKSWQSARRNYVLSQIPRTYSTATNLPTRNGLPYVVGSGGVSDLIGRYAFEDGANLGLDTSGRESHGMALNGVGVFTTAPPQGMTAAAFDSDDARITLPTSDLNLNAGTIAMWARWDIFDVSNHFLFGHYGNAAASTEQITIYTTGAFSNSLRIGLGDEADVSGPIVDLVRMQWTHVVLTWSAGNWSVYVNGSLSASGTYSGLNIKAPTAEIGNSGRGTNLGFNGRLDDVQIYSRALAANEVATVMEGGVVTGGGGTPGQTVIVTGRVDSAQAKRVTVNGQTADLNLNDGTWTFNPTGDSNRVITLVPQGSIWRYLDNGSDQGTAWRAAGFIDTGWKSGPAQLGYGDGDEVTVVDGGPSNQRYATTYFRHAFQLTNSASYTALRVLLMRDDGAAVYLNGVEIARDNLAAGAGYNDYASAAVSGSDESDFFSFNVDPALLQDGVNVLAVEVHQSGGTSSDLSFDLRLEGEQTIESETLLARGSVWRYLDNGSNQGTAWRAPAYDDTAWASGRAELGYGDGDEATVVSFGGSASNKHATTYFRTSFDLDDPAAFSALTIQLKYDDAAAVYINGVEVIRTSNLAANAAYNTYSGTDTPNENAFFEFTAPASVLVAGRNVVAVEIHQGDGSSSDISMDMEIVAKIGASNPLRLLSGINRVTVEAYDAANQVVYREAMDIWFDANTPVEASGMIATNTLWQADGGPYYVTGQLTIEAGATLTIEPGATVFFAPGAGMLVRGRLNAVGAAGKPIHMRPHPANVQPWAGIQFVDTQENNRLSFVEMLHGDARTNVIAAINAVVNLDHLVWTPSTKRIVEMNNATAAIRDSSFPSVDNNHAIHAVGVPVNGHLIIERNTFAPMTGQGAAMYVQGGRHPNPVPQVRDNILLGGGDDGLILNNADAHVEGNTFGPFVKAHAALGVAAAVVALDESLVTLARNLFRGGDYGLLAVQGSVVTAQANTFTRHGGAAMLFNEPDVASGEAAAIRIDDSIFFDNAATFAGLNESLTTLTVDHSILPTSQHHLGEGNFEADPMFLDPAADFRLRTGSPAKGRGINGGTLGYTALPGATILGEPAPITWRSDVILTIAGPGITHYTYSLDGGPLSPLIPVATPFDIEGLPPGVHSVEVFGRDSAGVAQSAESQSLSWTVDPDYAAILINEVLALNNNTAVGNNFPDLIELYNAGPALVDLAGYSMSDDPSNPLKHVFPPGTTIAAGEYLVLVASGSTQPGRVNFSLSGDGEAVYLYGPNGQLLDAVEFGIQVPDHSIGRGRDGQWQLNKPTFGSPNVTLEPASPHRLKINEWLANGDFFIADDYIELFNPDPLVVAVGGAYLTDDPIHRPTLHRIAPLSFIAPNGYGVFLPTGEPERGPNHLNFRLASDLEMIGLFDANGRRIDALQYGPQRVDVSQGRSPDGARPIASFSTPNPGQSNPVVNSVGQSVTLFDYSVAWRYNDSGQNLGTTWREPGYNDSAWSSGAGPLGRETDALPIPLATTVNHQSGKITYYFRRSFNYAGPLTGVTLSLSAMFDDGAVVYLNGVEVLRSRMPSGNINFDTLANSSVGNASIESFGNIPAGALVQGLNVIAVEVHQVDAGSSDIVMGLKLDAVTPPPDAEPNNTQLLLDGLRVTEIMFDPAGGPDHEFIELQNIGAEPIKLDGVRFTTGIEFTFPPMTLAPGQYVVIAGDEDAFIARYGPDRNLAGEFSGNLANNGESLALTLPSPLTGNILAFTYDATWLDGSPRRAIVMIDTAASRLTGWNDPDNWRPSPNRPGSPGGPDVAADANADLLLNADDIDFIHAQALLGSTDPALDLDYNGSIDAADAVEFVEGVLRTFRGDLNLDFVVNIADLAAMATFFGSADVGWVRGDLNGDRLVNIADLAILATFFGSVSPGAGGGASELTAAPSADAAPVADLLADASPRGVVLAPFTTQAPRTIANSARWAHIIDLLHDAPAVE